MSENNALEALQFYLDNDLDEVLCEELVDHFAAKEVTHAPKVNTTETQKAKIEIIQEPIKKAATSFIKPAVSTSQSLSKLAKQFTQEGYNADDASISINAIVERAKVAAKNSSNLEELKKAVESFDGCNLKKMATNTVFSDGNADSKVMIIDEAPGNDEDLRGLPFCGDAGRMLDQMFGAINMSRKENIYIANILFWRPPGNRKPTREELAICKPFVERHIELVNPDVIVLIGSTAMNAILDVASPITKVRGEFMDFAPEFLSKPIKAFTIFHPSYLIKQPSKKKIAWKDLLALEQFLKDNK